MNAERLGIASVLLGAGRKTKEEAIDPAAGIELVKKLVTKLKRVKQSLFFMLRMKTGYMRHFRS